MQKTNSIKERFFHSCETGDLEVVKTALFHSVQPFSQDKFGNTGIHLACMKNQYEVLNYLLKTVKTYKKDVENKLGRTALNIAASQGAYECIDILVTNLYCDFNSTDKHFKNTPLHWCVISKCISGVKRLLDIGADYTLTNKLGKTPLQLAENTCLDMFYYIKEFIEKKNKHNNKSEIVTRSTQKNIDPLLSAKSCTPQFNTNANQSSKSETNFIKKTINDNTMYNDTIPELNNSNNPCFLNISNIKNGDNSVLKQLEKAIEPIDETSFVSSILNSGKVIQLTEAGILALEYTKNEVNIPIPKRLVKSFLKSSSKNNSHENNLENKNFENDDDSVTNIKGQKRLKNEESTNKRIKRNEPINKRLKTLLDVLNQDLIRVSSNKKNQKSASTVNTKSDSRYNEADSSNQLMCFDPDMSSRRKWVEELTLLLQKNECKNIPANELL
ncbi:myb-like protein D [Adelges cooleyi]|uniref:myb-like protein D n=1 Tax=Adelges cooleyi TaxID=133065 RepID=UPI00217F91FC|nr:myb-like protein D [Adelges cooleyi]